MRRPGGSCFAIAIAAIAVNACVSAVPQETGAAPAAETADAGLHPVQPTPLGAPATPAPEPPELRIAAGRFFAYALPPGWRVGEDGQFALTLHAPDNKAITVMVGNAGYPPPYPPAQFVSEKMMALQPANLRIGSPRPAAPAAGFAQAYEFEVAYEAQAVPCRGLIKCHIAPAYDSAVMAMTAALSEESQWPGYASWLPAVAEQISAVNGAAFGMRGVMAQNLSTSTAYAAAAGQYREWSRRNWQQTTDQRNASQDRINFHSRENLGGVHAYVNPYDPSVPLELPGAYEHYWVDRQGKVLGTNDPGADPNAAEEDWRRMPRFQP